MTFKKTIITAFLMFIALLLISSCKNNTNTNENTSANTTSKAYEINELILKTPDNVNLAAKLYEPKQKNLKAVLLLHMLGQGKESFDDFANILADKGFIVLTMDFRGHGKSTNNGLIDYNNFNDDDWQGILIDAKTAFEYLDKQKNISSIAVAGASIGANTALITAVENQQIYAVVLLSPGLNYRSITTKEYAINYNKKAYIIASKRDKYAMESSNSLFNLLKTQDNDKQIKIYDGGEHGTRIFEAHPELMEELADWLSK